MIHWLLARPRRHILAEWWWTLDRVTLCLLAILMLAGVTMSFAASPAVALRIELGTYYFLHKQLIFMIAAILTIVSVSLLAPKWIFRLAIGLTLIAFVGMIVTLFAAPLVKGATRWLYIGGISIQPSEFIKPGLVVVLAVLFAERHKKLRPFVISVGMMVLLGGLLITQPDIGQLVLMSLLWGYLYYIAGGKLAILGGLVIIALATGILLYASLDHFASRIDRFVNPSIGDNYQIEHAIEAMRSGRMLGVGLGNGEVKAYIPDAHADYVFAVAVEEGGFIAGSIIIMLFAVLAFRLLRRCAYDPDHRIQLATAGLTALIVTQAAINLAVNLNLVPAKGMTLPFISYGGSSLLALAIAVGMLMGLTRRRIMTHYQTPPVTTYSTEISKQWGGAWR